VIAIRPSSSGLNMYASSRSHSISVLAANNQPATMENEIHLHEFFMSGLNHLCHSLEHIGCPYSIQSITLELTEAGNDGMLCRCQVSEVFILLCRTRADAKPGVKGSKGTWRSRDYARMGFLNNDRMSSLGLRGGWRCRKMGRNFV